MGKRQTLIDDIKRLRIEKLLNEGCSISKAAKLEGISYKHAKQIAEQTVEGERPSGMRNPE